MVERLKDAIEKARRERESAARQAPLTPAPQQQPEAGRDEAAWSHLKPLPIDVAKLEKARIVTATKSHHAHVSFDVLRTRLLKVCRDNGWRRIAVTSPSKGCGKSFVCLNLAFSFSRNPQVKAVVIDLDLKDPQLAKLLDAPGPRTFVSFLEGAASSDSAFQRFGNNLAIALNDKPVRNSAELLQSEIAGRALDGVLSGLHADVVLIDLPPMLVSDDVLASLTHVDALLLVAGAGLTTAAQIQECERLLGDSTPFLGVVLNKVDDADMETYETAYVANAVAD